MRWVECFQVLNVAFEKRGVMHLLNILLVQVEGRLLGEIGMLLCDLETLTLKSTPWGRQESEMLDFFKTGKRAVQSMRLLNNETNSLVMLTSMLTLISVIHFPSPAP